MKKIFLPAVFIAATLYAGAQTTIPGPPPTGPDVSITSLWLGYDPSAKSLPPNAGGSLNKGSQAINVPAKCVVTMRVDKANATNVTLSMDFPAGISMISTPAGAKQLRTYPLLTGNAPPSQRVIWQFDAGAMTAGQTMIATFIYLPDPNANKISATVSCYPNDINPNNNTKGGIL